MKRLVLIFMMIITYQFTEGQSSIYFGKKSITPKIPPKEERMRVIIATDAMNEIDDVWAIALAVLSPERFEIEGFIGGNYDHTSLGVGPKSIELSVKVIDTILNKAGLKGKYPVYAGSHPMQYEFLPSGSEGVDFIVERAMAGSPDNPLWIIGLGSSTDIASAYLQEPEIKDRVVVFWHARTEETWPYRAHNYNVKGDMHAARMLFHAPFPLVLFDTGTKLSAGNLKESEKYVKPYGELGEYLYNFRLRSAHYSSETKGFFDLGDIAVLIDPDLGKWEETRCPTVTKYMDYNFYSDNGTLLRCYAIDRDKTFKLFYRKLKENYEMVQE